MWCFAAGVNFQPDLVGKSHHTTDGGFLHTYNLVSLHTHMILWEGTHTLSGGTIPNTGVTEPWWEKPTHKHDK